jgi:hypothetical protein
LLVCVATALTAGGVTAAAAKQRKHPYLFLTVSRGMVTKVRWQVYYHCPAADDLGFQTGQVVLNARIRNGRFDKRITYVNGGSNLGSDSSTTRVRGTLTGNTAAVKFRDDESIVSYGGCTGTNSFTLRKTRTGWASP